MAETKRDQVLGMVGDVGAELLLETALKSLEKLLVRNKLSVELDGKVQRATLYRHVKDDRSVVMAVVKRVSSPEWAGFAQVLDSVMDSYMHAISSVTDRVGFENHLKSMLAMNFEAQFHSPGTPAGWMIHSAALTSSPAWQNQHPAPELDALGQEILAIRAAFYDRMQASLVHMLDLTLSHVGRRPRPPLTSDDIVMSMMALNDGLVLRAFADPDCIDAHAAADRLLQLCWAMTETGPGYDQRRPSDVDEIALFDSTIALAVDRWQTGPLDRERFCAEAPCGPKLFSAWFPTLYDLADSSARALFATLGLDFQGAGADHAAAVIQVGLTAVANAVEEQPALFKLLMAPGWESQSGAVLTELRLSLENALRPTPVRQPEHVALSMVRSALTGRAGLPDIRLRLAFAKPG